MLDCLRKFALLFWIAAVSATTAADTPTRQVLFLGDLLQQQIMQAAQKELKGQVSIHFPREPVADHSGAALNHFEKLIGDKRWDLIYFNFGMGDLTYRDPRTKAIRKMGKDVGGVRVAPPEQYAQNIDELATKLQATGAKIIWGSTTPLSNLGYSYRLLDPNSEIPYNEIAASIMSKHSIPIVDLHAFVTDQLANEKKPPKYTDLVKHFSKKDKPLHQPLVATIRQQLQLPETK